MIQFEELPDCYRTDELFEVPDAVDEIEGRGPRRRTVFNYNDDLDDDQWAMALEDGEGINEVSDRNRKFESTVGTPIPEAPESNRGRGRGSRERPRLKDEGAPNGKRKRTKAASVTPSTNDDDEVSDCGVCIRSFLTITKLIKKPIAMSPLRERINARNYKTVTEL